MHPASKVKNLSGWPTSNPVDLNTAKKRQTIQQERSANTRKGLPENNTTYDGNLFTSPDPKCGGGCQCPKSNNNYGPNNYRQRENNRDYHEVQCREGNFHQGHNQYGGSPLTNYNFEDHQNYTQVHHGRNHHESFEFSAMMSGRQFHPKQNTIQPTPMPAMACGRGGPKRGAGAGSQLESSPILDPEELAIWNEDDGSTVQALKTRIKFLEHELKKSEQTNQALSTESQKLQMQLGQAHQRLETDAKALKTELDRFKKTYDELMAQQAKHLEEITNLKADNNQLLEEKGKLLASIKVMNDRRVEPVVLTQQVSPKYSRSRIDECSNDSQEVENELSEHHQHQTVEEGCLRNLGGATSKLKQMKKKIGGTPSVIEANNSANRNQAYQPGQYSKPEVSVTRMEPVVLTYEASTGKYIRKENGTVRPLENSNGALDQFKALMVQMSPNQGAAIEQKRLDIQGDHTQKNTSSGHQIINPNIGVSHQLLSQQQQSFNFQQPSLMMTAADGIAISAGKSPQLIKPVSGFPPQQQVNQAEVQGNGMTYNNIRRTVQGGVPISAPVPGPTPIGFSNGFPQQQNFQQHVNYYPQTQNLQQNQIPSTMMNQNPTQMVAPQWTQQRGQVQQTSQPVAQRGQQYLGFAPGKNMQMAA